MNQTFTNKGGGSRAGAPCLFRQGTCPPSSGDSPRRRFSTSPRSSGCNGSARPRSRAEPLHPEDRGLVENRRRGESPDDGGQVPCRKRQGAPARLPPPLLVKV